MKKLVKAIVGVCLAVVVGLPVSSMNVCAAEPNWKSAYKQVLADPTKTKFDQFTLLEVNKEAPILICQDAVMREWHYYGVDSNNKVVAYDVPISLWGWKGTGEYADGMLSSGGEGGTGAITFIKFGLPENQYVTIAHYEVDWDDTLNYDTLYYDQNNKVISAIQYDAIETAFDKKYEKIILQDNTPENRSKVIDGYIVKSSSTPASVNNSALPQSPKFTINGTPKTFKNKIRNVSGRTLFPLRESLEMLGAKVYWDKDTTTITCSFDVNTVEFVINDNTYKINGKRVKMDDGVSAQIIDGNTYIPIRYAAEGLGFTVGWNAGSSTVAVKSAAKGTKVTVPDSLVVSNAAPTQEPKPVVDYESLYNTFKNNHPYDKFAYYDFEKDGMPELVLMKQPQDPMDEDSYGYFAIYTINNNSVTEIYNKEFSFPRWFNKAYEGSDQYAKGIIVEWNVYHSGSSVQYLQMKNGKIQEEYMAESERLHAEDRGYYDAYTINEKVYSYEQFEKFLSQFKVLFDN